MFILRAEFLASATWIMIPVTQTLVALMCFSQDQVWACAHLMA